MGITALNPGWVSGQIGKLLGLTGLLLTVDASLGAVGQRAVGQIRADDTLDAEQSLVIPTDSIGIPADLIDGGALRGGNLFHSFREFNVRQGRSVYFRNPSNVVENILARVTGNTRSEILGELGVVNAPGITSTPNLFLLNPNGIIFGADASLNVGGSFVASTASAIRLGDRGEFSASAPETSNLLSIAPSALLFNQVAAQPINSRATLRVPNGSSLLLVGGDVNLNGSRLVAQGGHIGIGAIAGTGAIGFRDDLRLRFSPDLPRADVSFANLAFASVSAGDRGSITINARNIRFQNSLLLGGINGDLGSVASQAGDIVLDAAGVISLSQTSGILNTVGEGGTGNSGDIRLQARAVRLTDNSALTTTTSGRGEGGDILINARDAVVFEGGGAVSDVEATGVGDAGNLRINTGSLLVRNGASLSTGTVGRGSAGDIRIQASDRITVDGRSDTDPSRIASGIAAGGIGDAGDVTLRAGSLFVTNGATLGAATAGNGDGGDVTIVTRDRVFLSGLASLQQGESGIVNGVLSTASEDADAGNIRISTRTLEVTNRAGLATVTQGSGQAGDIFLDARDMVTFDTEGIAIAGVALGGTGDAGNLRIATGSLQISGGAFVQAATAGAGDAGTLFINARDRVVIEGDGTVVSTGVLIAGTGDAGDVRLTANTLLLDESAQLSAGVVFGTGQAGNITIQTRDRVSIEDEAALAVLSIGASDAGNLEVTTPLLQLEDGGLLLATSFLGEGGDIQLNVPDILVLRRGSFISAASAVLGNDGNIGIDTNFLVAVPTENSDIVAVSNPLEGRSGNNIDITALGVYGTEFRESVTAASDITATGEVTIALPDIDPSRSIVALPADIGDASGLIAQSCPTGGTTDNLGEFVVTGRGGLPPNPDETLSSEEVLTPWVTASDSAERAATDATIASPQSVPSTAEAQGWVINPEGEVVLVAQALLPSPAASIPIPCNGS